MASSKTQICRRLQITQTSAESGTRS